MRQLNTHYATTNAIRNYGTKGESNMNIQAKVKQLVHNNPGQMSYNEYMAIATPLLQIAPCNMLIFGCGKDTDMWLELNAAGYTRFIENNKEWVKYPECTITVNYGTKRGQAKSPEEAEQLTANMDLESHVDGLKVDSIDEIKDTTKGKDYEHK